MQLLCLICGLDVDLWRKIIWVKCIGTNFLIKFCGSKCFDWWKLTSQFWLRTEFYPAWIWRILTPPSRVNIINLALIWQCWTWYGKPTWFSFCSLHAGQSWLVLLETLFRYIPQPNPFWPLEAPMGLVVHPGSATPRRRQLHAVVWWHR
jgi:hypothetical protein